MASKKRKSSIIDFFNKRPRVDCRDEFDESRTDEVRDTQQQDQKIAKGQRKSGFDTHWKKDFPWVELATDGAFLEVIFKV